MRAGVSLAVLGVLMAGGSSAYGAQPHPGDVIVGDSSKDKVYWLEPDTGDKHVLSDDSRFKAPNDSAFSPNGKKLYVTDYEAFQDNGAVFTLNPKTGRTRVLTKDEDLVQPDGIDVGPNGTVWVTDLSATVDDGALFKVDPGGGDANLVSSGGGLDDALGVVVPGNGKPFVSSSAFPSIVRVNPTNGGQTTIADAGDGLTAEGGLARGSDGTLYTADETEDVVQSVDPGTADVDEVATGFGYDGYGLAIDRRGRVLGGDGATVNRADPETGNSKEIGDHFGYAEGVEVVPR